MHWASLAAWVAFAAPQEADLSEQVRGGIRRLNEDRIEDRERAVADLVRLGRKALPYLFQHAAQRDVETRGRIQAAIERIHRTDPLFLVRAPERRITVDFRDLSLEEAIQRIFGPYPVQLRFDRDVRKRITVALRNATFWEAVEALEKAAGVTFSGSLFHELPPWEEQWASKPHGVCRFSALRTRGYKDAQVVVKVAFEPGWRPVDIDYDPGRWVTPEGAEVQRGTPWRKVRPGLEFPHAPDGLCQEELESFRLRDVPPGTRAVLRATARITFAREVEALAYFARDFTGPDTRRVGDCTLVLERLKLSADRGEGRLETSGPYDWHPPADKPFLRYFWSFLHDEEGNVRNLGCLTYTKRVSTGFNCEWTFPSTPTRYTILRPVEVERIDVPFEIPDVLLLPK